MHNFLCMFFCKNDDTSFFEKIISLHISGVYIHGQMALEGIDVLNMY